MSISDRPYIHTDFWVHAFPIRAKVFGFLFGMAGTGKSGVLYKEGLIDIQGGSGDKSEIVSS
jgi:hypothetical protein